MQLLVPATFFLLSTVTPTASATPQPASSPSPTTIPTAVPLVHSEPSSSFKAAAGTTGDSDSVLTGGYLSTCDTPSWNGVSDIITECLDGDENWQSTSLNLNDCLGNRDGILVWPGDKFLSTCYNVYLDSTNLCATCYTTSGGNDGVQCIGTNTFVSNTNGVLTC